MLYPFTDLLQSLVKGKVLLPSSLLPSTAESGGLPDPVNTSPDIQFTFCLNTLSIIFNVTLLYFIIY